MADLRDSGAVEQDADIVMLLHRPHYYGQDAPPEQCDCIVTKNRRGPELTVQLGFTGIYTRFYDPQEQGIDV
jgi:replicative DNA helicase